jgi:hypothetical protein
LAITSPISGGRLVGIVRFRTQTMEFFLWSWALLDRPLDGFPAFYGTQKFSTKFTRSLHLFLSWATFSAINARPSRTRLYV